MTSYEEIVVDQSINDGWKTFRTRLADHLLSDDFTQPIDLVPADKDSGVLILEDPDGGICVVTVFDKPGTAGTRTLRGLGFRKVEVNGTWQLSVDCRFADRAAHGVYVVLHELLGVIHPSLIDADPADLGLWDDLADEAPAPVVVPPLGYPNDPAGLQALVDATMEEEFGHPPHKDDDGDIPVHTDDGGTAFISVQGDFAVEVWSILACDVDRSKARRAMQRLSLKYPLHKFHLKGRALIASVPLFAQPFVPELLAAALRGTLHVSAEESERQSRRLRRVESPKRRGSGPCGTPPSQDPPSFTADDDAPSSEQARRKKKS